MSNQHFVCLFQRNIFAFDFNNKPTYDLFLYIRKSRIEIIIDVHSKSER